MLDKFESVCFYNNNISFINKLDLRFVEHEKDNNYSVELRDRNGVLVILYDTLEEFFDYFSEYNGSIRTTNLYEISIEENTENHEET